MEPSEDRPRVSRARPPAHHPRRPGTRPWAPRRDPHRRYGRSTPHRCILRASCSTLASHTGPEHADEAPIHGAGSGPRPGRDRRLLREIATFERQGRVVTKNHKHIEAEHAFVRWSDETGKLVGPQRLTICYWGVEGQSCGPMDIGRRSTHAHRLGRPNWKPSLANISRDRLSAL